MRRILPILAALALLAGCGGDDAATPAPVTVALDFTPNPVHAPLYAAARETPLRIRPPGASADSLKLVATGKVDLGLLDIHDLAIAREQGSDVVAIGALIGRPLAALLALPHVRRPRDLEGRRLGVSGLPSDPAFARAIVEHDGGDYDRVKEVTIGFTAVSRLLSRRIDAAPAFWNAEGVALRRRGRRIREFRVEDYGAPSYPEVVVITSPRTLRTQRERLAGALRAIRGGIIAVRDNPEDYVPELAAAAGTDDLTLVGAQLRAVMDLYDDDLRPSRGVLREWAAFDAEIGIVRRPPDVDAAFDLSLVE